MTRMLFTTVGNFDLCTVHGLSIISWIQTHLSFEICSSKRTASQTRVLRSDGVTHVILPTRFHRASLRKAAGEWPGDSATSSLQSIVLLYAIGREYKLSAALRLRSSFKYNLVGCLHLDKRSGASQSRRNSKVVYREDIPWFIKWRSVSPILFFFFFLTVRQSSIQI